MKIKRIVLGLLILSQLPLTGCLWRHNQCKPGLFGNHSRRRTAETMVVPGGAECCNQGWGGEMSGGAMLMSPGNRLEADETLKAPQKAWPGPGAGAAPEKK